MLFNSLTFVIFCFLFFAFWGLFKKSANHRWVYITICSFIFYGWWDWRFLFLIIFSGLIDYFAGLYMIRFHNQRKIILWLSMATNIGSLAIFKYAHFLSDNIAKLGLFLGLNWQLIEPGFSIILPVGISFYTFQSMSYTIDIYRGELKPTRNIFHFFAYLSLFPQLVAGPIVRAKDLLPQMEKWHFVSEKEKWNGFKLIVFGFFKKMVIADNLAPFVSESFSNTNSTSSSLYWWLAVLSFSIQIYGDFSGYSDIARGLAKWMGYNFRLNFNHPYSATSIKDFWNRWHISLSTWFRDYLYIPLGGSKKGLAMGLLFMWITMLVSGLWHGAGWGFIVWGALHAFYLSVERLTGLFNPAYSRGMFRILFWIIVQIQVCISWVFFRADDFSEAIKVIGHMISFDVSNLPSIESKVLIILLVMFFYELLIVIKNGPLVWKKFVKQQRRSEIIVMAILIVLIFYFKGEGSEFIYFQF